MCMGVAFFGGMDNVLRKRKPWTENMSALPRNIRAERVILSLVPVWRLQRQELKPLACDGAIKRRQSEAIYTSKRTHSPIFMQKKQKDTRFIVCVVVVNMCMGSVGDRDSLQWTKMVILLPGTIVRKCCGYFCNGVIHLTKTRTPSAHIHTLPYPQHV